VYQIKGEEETIVKIVAIPWELKYKYMRGGYSSMLKGFMYAIREQYGTTAAKEILKKMWKMDDRVKKMTNTILNVFKIEGNDAETIARWWDVYCEINDLEITWLERSKTCCRSKVTKCPFKTEPEDLFGWNFPFQDIVVKTINPKASAELPIAMCKGDSHCEYIYKIEE
jgi:hypothetical protein